MDDDGSMDDPLSRFGVFVFWIRIFSFFQSLHLKQRDIFFSFVVQIVMDKEGERMQDDGVYAVVDRNECVLLLLFVILNRFRSRSRWNVNVKVFERAKTQNVPNRMPEQKGNNAKKHCFDCVSLYFCVESRI